MQETDDPEVLTLEQAAAFFKVDPTTLKRNAEALGIPHRKLGSLWRFYRPALVAWMQEQENVAA